MAKSKADIKSILADRVNSLTVQDDITANTAIVSDNLDLYNKVRSVPSEAQKQITGGRLSGMTDINPMWRIKTLTEQLGTVGFGWYYTVNRMWLEHGANDEIAAFVEIDLYIKQNDEWSKPIKGVGGSSFVTKENKGLHTNDDCYKMALTDAISISCKSLGFAADIYFEKDKSKYQNDSDNPPDTSPPNNTPKPELTEKQLKRLYAMRNSAGLTEDTLKKIMIKYYNKYNAEELTLNEYDFICNQLDEMINSKKNIA